MYKNHTVTWPCKKIWLKIDPKIWWKKKLNLEPLIFTIELQPQWKIHIINFLRQLEQFINTSIFDKNVIGFFYQPLSNKKLTTSLWPFSQDLNNRVLAPPGAKLIRFWIEPGSKAVRIDFTAGKSPWKNRKCGFIWEIRKKIGL